MKSIVTSMIVAAGLMIAGSAIAADMPPLAKKSNCTSCHAIDKKIVGPSWMDVSKKYKGQDVKAQLVKKVCKGGAGAWGSMPMPANCPAVKEEAVGELVDFIIGLAK